MTEHAGLHPEPVLLGAAHLVPALGLSTCAVRETHDHAGRQHLIPDGMLLQEPKMGSPRWDDPEPRDDPTSRALRRGSSSGRCL